MQKIYIVDEGDVNMFNRHKWLITGNILPILVSLLIYMTITNNQYHLWVWYDAIIVPIFLLLYNFFAYIKSFSGVKLLIAPCINAICFLIHMLFFNFNFSGTSGIIWLIFTVISLAVMVVGSTILYFISKRLRSK